MPVQEVSQGKPYLSIVGGRLAQKVDKTTEGAKRREYKNQDGEICEKYELIYKSCSGKIQSVTFKDTEYGKMLNIELDDYILSLNTESRYFQDIAKRLAGTDWSLTHSFAPYEFEDDNGKQRSGVSVKVNDEKVGSHFYDPEKKENTNGFPEPDFNTDEADSDDWKGYFIKTKKFLVKWLEDKADNFTQSNEPDMASEAKESTGVESYDEAEDGTKVEDLPF